MRRRRWRWMGVGIVLALGLYAVGDIVMLQYMESQGAVEVARAMAAEEATVDLGGFPFLPGFVRGRLRDVSVEVRGVSATGGLRVHSVDARMSEARFRTSDVFALARSRFATRTTVDALEPFGAMELTEADLQSFIRGAVPLVGHVRVRGSGIEVRFIREEVVLLEHQVPTEDMLTEPARFLPRIEDGRLVLSLTSVAQLEPVFRADAARIERLIQLPRIPLGLRPDVGLRNRVVVVEAQGPELSLEVGEGAAD